MWIHLPWLWDVQSCWEFIQNVDHHLLAHTVVVTQNLDQIKNSTES